MNGSFLENFYIIPDHIVDMNGAAITGDYVSLKNAKRATYVHIFGDGTAGSDVDYEFKQATAVAGTGAKDLNICKTGRIFTKEHASALSSLAAAWVRETQATADEVFPTGGATDNGEVVGIYAFDILPSDLDVSNNFDCVQCNVDGQGAAKLGCGFWILERKDPSLPELEINALAD